MKKYKITITTKGGMQYQYNGEGVPRQTPSELLFKTEDGLEVVFNRSEVSHFTIKSTDGE